MKIDSPTSSPGPTITCYGALRSVTGSMHLVVCGGRKILLDCGLVRGPRSPALDDRHFPFDAGSIDAVVLSHAHIDHCGNLPRLIRQGFRGPIYCTPATSDLAGLMLADSARIQAEDAHVLHVIGVPGGRHAQPPFTGQDVEQTGRQYIGIPYGETREIFAGIRLRLANAGHVLGSAMIHLQFNHAGKESSLTFTGDLGRPGLPMLNGPDPIPAADFILSEGTNGGRVLPGLTEAVAKLETLVQLTVERGGKVALAAFSTGRIQVLTHYLLEARQAGRIPSVPIYVDGPLASDISGVYGRHHGSNFHGAESAIRYIRAADESRELSKASGSYVVLAPGGMCEGTRIQNHLQETIDDPRCSIAMVCYQAPHSVGHRMLEPGPTVRFLGRKWNRWADIVELAGFSGHPDETELLDGFAPLAGKVRKVRLIHGEMENLSKLAKLLRGQGFTDVQAPMLGETMAID